MAYQDFREFLAALEKEEATLNSKRRGETGAGSGRRG